MKVNQKNSRNLPAGTVIERGNGIIQLESEYDEFHGWYEAVELKIDDEGIMFEDESCERFNVTPADITGGEII